MDEDLKGKAYSLNEQLIEWRRDFHRHPEVAFQEKRTAEVIQKFLVNLGLDVRKAAGTGLVAVLEGLPGGSAVALRADMDALPLKEEGDKEFISLNPEAAHACGHDGHMAILMGVAELLSQRRKQFKGKVIFIFQPAEELLPGGAKPMIEEGALEGAEAVFGLHLWQPLPTGSVGVVKGPMMAFPDSFTIEVIGKGGHGSAPHLTVDPIMTAAQLVVNLQSIVSRNVDPLKPCVVSFGTIKGGTIFNIIPSRVSLTGTVRTFDPAVRKLMEKRLREVAEKTCQAFGATCELKYEKGYPAVVNDPGMVDLIIQTAKQVLGDDCLKQIDPVMGGEDFAYYLQKVPGAFLFFGAGDGKPHPHHHPAFDIDEKALPQGVLLLAAVALEFLRRKD